MKSHLQNTMNRPRGQFLGTAGAAAAWPGLSQLAWAQAYPSRPVRLIVGFAAGGPGDILSRLIGQWLSERLGRPFVIENRAGGNGNVAAEAVVRAPPRRLTLLPGGPSGPLPPPPLANPPFPLLSPHL